MSDQNLDIIAANADFEDVVVGKTDRDLLALYFAVAKYDEDIRCGRAKIVVHDA